jgi:hypothetical protein
MTNLHGDQAPTEQQKMLKKFENSSKKTSHQTIPELADTIGISYGVCQEILTENWNMHHITVKFVPRLLT